MKMKILFLLIAFIAVYSFAYPAFAHPGNTDYLGCHTCRTNCQSWGLYYGEYHCHEPKYYSPPETYTPPPSCPLLSYYDSLSESCKCYSGYVVSGDRCISQDDWCQNQFGFNSRYNILNDSCECSYGYIFEGSKCISGNQYCWNKYGYNSSYNSLSKSCECSYGYVFNKARTQCISQDDWCQDEFGYGSEYDSLEDNCVCSDGYRFDGSECVWDTEDFHTFLPPAEIQPQIPELKPTTKPPVLPKQGTPKPNELSREQEARLSLTLTPTPELVDQQDQEPPQKNLLIIIWQFVMNLFRR